MRTTVEIPDELFRRAKVEAALHGRTLKDLVEEGLRLVIEKKLPEAPAAEKKMELAKPRPGSLHEAMQDLCGIIEDGPPDLATNKKYFEDFGR
jgi:plasmid stability protein